MFSRESYTLNFDGSHNNQANTASAGCIVRDSKGDLVVAAAYNLTNINLPYVNVAVAEAIGLRNGLKLANKRNLKLAFIKGDSKQVIDLVLNQTRRQTGPPLFDIIVEIKELLISQRSAQVELINREDNKVADKFAFLGSSLLSEYKVFDRFDPLPSPVSELIRQDKAKERNDEEGSSSLGTTTTRLALLAVTGLAIGAASIFFSGDSSSASSDQQEARRITRNAHNPRTPRADFYTLQYFGSDRNQVQKARAGCIILKNGGEFFVAAAYNLSHQYPNCHIAIAEAIALKNGLKLAKDNNVRLNSIQGRNVEVRDRVLDRERRPPRSPELSTFIQQIKYALYEQGVDLDDTLELVDEETIKKARALATVGGTLYQEAITYQSVNALPRSVADLFG